MITSQPHFRAALLVVLAGWAFLLDTPIRSQENTPEIKQLLKQRSDLLNGTLKIALAQYEQGFVDISQLLVLERDSRRAGRELDNPKDRLAALRISLEFAQKMVNQVANRQRVGIAKQIDVDQTRAAVLEARIDLLREEQKQKPVKP